MDFAMARHHHHHHHRRGRSSKGASRFLRAHWWWLLPLSCALAFLLWRNWEEVDAALWLGVEEEEVAEEEQPLYNDGEQYVL